MLNQGGYNYNLFSYSKPRGSVDPDDKWKQIYASDHDYVLPRLWALITDDIFFIYKFQMSPGFFSCHDDKQKTFT